MSINVSCPCGARLKAKEEFAGKRVKCPSCGQVLTMPHPTPATPPTRLAESVPLATPSAPGAMQSGANVWFASEERVRSASKVLVFDDKGVLRATKDGLRFDGRKQQWNLNNIQRVSLVTQQFPWKTYLVIDAAIVAVFFLQVAVAAATGELTGIGQILGALVGSMFMLLVVNGLGLFIAHQMKWIRIDHRDDAGHPSASFFAASSGMGWGGIFGGTEQLYARLTSAPSGERPLSSAPPAQVTPTYGTVQPDIGSTSSGSTTSAWAVISLMLGIMSVPTLCCFFPAFLTCPAAIVTGHVARYTIRQSNGQRTGDGLALAGLALGYGVLVVLIGFVILAFIGRIEFHIPAR